MPCWRHVSGRFLFVVFRIARALVPHVHKTRTVSAAFERTAVTLLVYCLCLPDMPDALTPPSGPIVLASAGAAAAA